MHTKNRTFSRQDRAAAAARINKFIIKNRDKLTHEAGVVRANEKINNRSEFQQVMCGEELGAGGYGTVYAYGNQGKSVIKRIKLTTETSLFDLQCEQIMSCWVPTKYYLRRTRFLQDPQNPHDVIIECPRALSDAKSIFYSSENVPKDVPTEVIAEYAHFILNATLASIQYKFRHNDVKLQNVLVMEDGQFKLTDYSLTKFYTEECEHETALLHLSVFSDSYQDIFKGDKIYSNGLFTYLHPIGHLLDLLENYCNDNTHIGKLEELLQELDKIGEYELTIVNLLKDIKKCDLNTPEGKAKKEDFQIQIKSLKSKVFDQLKSIAHEGHQLWQYNEGGQQKSLLDSSKSRAWIKKEAISMPTVDKKSKRKIQDDFIPEKRQRQDLI